MSGKKIVAFALLAAGGVLGGVAARAESPRVAAERAESAAKDATEQARSRLDAERHRLESRVLAAAQLKPLLAALNQNVDGVTLLDLFQSEDWWRDVRAEFPIVRVVLDTEVLASYGSPDPGTSDQALAIEARKSPVASAVVPIQNQTYFLLACRLAAMPDRSPVLVLAKKVDAALLATATVAPPAPAPQPTQIQLLAGAALLVLGGGFLLIFSRSTSSASGALAPGDAPRESTLKFGDTAAKPAAVEVASPRGGGAGTGLSPSASPVATLPPAASSPAASSASSAQARPRSYDAAAPAPVQVPSTPVPVGPPRRPTASGGVPIAQDGKPGQKFGRYQLLDRLGEGGMAEVFTAVAHGAEGFSRVFVLKRLRAELSRDKEAIAQFVDEARVQSNLVHSNIVPVFDFGRVGDQYFMTQEYIVGRDLLRLITRYYEHSRQTLIPRLAYYVAHETLQALEYAHTKRSREGQHLGMVHRDVSVGNIIVSAQGEVKLADFGIVKSNSRVSKTQSGMVKGNANFMSPEQARGHAVDARSDLFSVAVVLYYCLTNRLLYDGDNDLEVLYKAASGPTIEHYDIIRRLASPASDVLGRALATDPADRFQSAGEFADVLAPHIGGAKAEAARLMQTLFGNELRSEAA